MRERRGSERFAYKEPEALRPVPDMAGIPVDDAEGHYVGDVYGAMADAESGLIRYLDLELHDSNRHILVPLGHTQIEEPGELERDRPRIQLRAAVRDELEEIPPFEPDTRADSSYQRDVLGAHGRVFYGERYYAHPAYDHRGLFAGEHPIVRGPSEIRPTEPLEPLTDLPGYAVAEGESDIRGWPLIDRNGRRVGQVDDLLVDTEAGKVRYALVSLDEADKRVLVPVGYLQVRPGAEEVRTPSLALDDLDALPAYQLGPVTRGEEDRIREVLDRRLDGDRRFERPDFASP